MEKTITLFGNGDSSRDYTYIDDIIRGILKAVEHLNGFEIFNLGESDVIELKRLVEEIEIALDQQAHIEYLAMQPGDVNTTFADISKAKNKLEYNPQVKISKGLEKYVQWLRERVDLLISEKAKR